MEDLLRRSFLYDEAFFHEDHMVGHVFREVHLVGDDDHGHVIGGQVTDDF